MFTKYTSVSLPTLMENLSIVPFLFHNSLQIFKPNNYYSALKSNTHKRRALYPTGVEA